MLTFFMAGPEHVRWDLVAEPSGSFRLTVHHAQGVIVEHFATGLAALVRHRELEDLLARAQTPDRAAGEAIDS